MADTVTQAAPTIRARVAAGAAWLDKNRPGWDSRVDLDALCMPDPCYCILGQEFGDYYDAPISLDDGVAFGFDAEGAADEMAEFSALSTEWARLIEARRAEAVPAG